MIDLKAAAEAAKAATAAYIADPTDRETGRQWDRACAEFSLACTEDAILALYAERDEARASLEREYQNVCTVTRHLAEATKRAEAAEAAMGEPASHPLNTSAVVSHETANVSDKAATRKEALQVEAIRQAILDNCWGDSNGNVNGSHDAAKAIASLYASPRPEAEIARLTEARRKDAEAFESVRNANTIVRTRAKDAEALVERYRIALADAIRRPMGVIPGSAEGLVTANDLDAAEDRRQERESSP